MSKISDETRAHILEAAWDLMAKEAGCDGMDTVSKDGLFTISKVECLGSCDTAPMIQVNRDPYIENLNDEKAVQLIRDLKSKAGKA